MQVDGLLIDMSQNTFNKEFFYQVKKKRVPLVFFDRVLKDDQLAV